MATGGSGGGGGRMVRYAVGLPIAFKLGLDLGNLVSPLQSHYLEDEKEKKTDVWNAVGSDLVEQVKTSTPLQAQLGSEPASRVQVSDVLSLSKSHLKWQFFTHCSPDDSKVPLKTRSKGASDLSLVVDTHNDGRGWKVDNAWVETQGEGAVCVPLTPPRHA
ncbi:uncharacterized protein ACA1_310820 [Acanthamoeba castellanii str. Neff]|uniref:Uncharacterized protein n=1 Tax=Acanthamoeba castellanii (strain ATCC 30010 / Neff) TaxID=1257118 RepID=L8GUF6_ACACF|nr:uncharacterized protein ACA1_310820 [Acanthamoeba castellanii str. Neff]ELR16253.1 hypothetical protein ACA1_310820 [Acanthamoeba castellanii str. Neff]